MFRFRTMIMSNRIFFLFSLFFLVMSFGICSADDSNGTVNASEVEIIEKTLDESQSLEEGLMDLAFKAKEYALEAGKETALSEFSSPSGRFSTDETYIIAFDRTGVLLSDSKRSGDVGTQFISDDYDAGNVRQMGDFASTGGGLFIKEGTGESFFILDIDGQWWIAATSSSSSW